MLELQKEQKRLMEEIELRKSEQARQEQIKKRNDKSGSASGSNEKSESKDASR